MKRLKIRIFTLLDDIKIIKCRTNWKCFKCKNKIKKGSYCLGIDDYRYKVCLNCSNEYFEQRVRSLRGRILTSSERYVILNRFKKIRKQIKDNWAEYAGNNVVKGLQDD